MSEESKGVDSRNNIYYYGAFGKMKEALSKEKNSRLNYINKEQDLESGLRDHGVRKYDEDIGRFTSVDPLWSKYIGWTPYHYCGNDPINASDGNGKNFNLNVDSQDGHNTININIPIYLCGIDANPISEKYLVDGGNSIWNNNGEGWVVPDGRGTTYNLNISVSVFYGDAPGKENQYCCDNSVGRSGVRGSWNGVGVSNGWSPFHEMGHFLGLTDQYKDKEQYILGIIPNGIASQAIPGYEGTIMGERDGKVEQKTLNNLMKILQPYIDDTKKSNSKKTSVVEPMKLKDIK